MLLRKNAGVNDSLDITSDTMLAGLVTELQLRSAGIDFAIEVRHAVTSTAHRSRLLEFLSARTGSSTRCKRRVTTLEKSANITKIAPTTPASGKRPAGPLGQTSATS